MKLKCLIIDDETTARRGMQALVEEHADLQCVGVCTNGVEAIDQIRALKPDLVFLDVQMPGISGFEVLASLPRPWPAVIFTTAHDKFALKAFDVAAIDYLLKPFSDERFAEAVERAKRKIQTDQRPPAESADAEPIRLEENNGRLVIRSDGSVHLLAAENILYVEAFDYYVKIHVEGRFFLLRETMKKMSEKLENLGFVRIHKSSIVNLARIKALHQLDNHEYEVELSNRLRLKVSRNFRPGLVDKLKL